MKRTLLTATVITFACLLIFMAIDAESPLPLALLKIAAVCAIFCHLAILLLLKNPPTYATIAQAEAIFFLGVALAIAMAAAQWHLLSLIWAGLATANFIRYRFAKKAGA